MIDPQSLSKAQERARVCIASAVTPETVVHPSSGLTAGDVIALLQASYEPSLIRARYLGDANVER